MNEPTGTPLAQLLRAAADVIRTRGHYQGDYAACPGGAVCAGLERGGNGFLPPDAGVMLRKDARSR